MIYCFTYFHKYLIQLKTTNFITWHGFGENNDLDSSIGLSYSPIECGFFNSRFERISLCRNHVFWLNPPEGDELNMRSKFTTSNWFIFSLTDSLYTWKEIIIQLVDTTTFFIPLYCFSWAELYLCHLCNPTWCITIILILPHTSTKKTYVKKWYMIIWAVFLGELSCELNLGTPSNSLVKNIPETFKSQAYFVYFLQNDLVIYKLKVI